MFPPTDKDLRMEYPELAQVDEFKKLTQPEMLFVWHYANKTSKYINLPDRERVIKCLEVLKKDLSAQELQEYSQLVFPEHLKLAIERMQKYDPKVRDQAKTINETIFDNLNTIVNADVGEMDMEEKQKYVALSMNIVKNMSDMVAQIEHGYGIKENGKKKEADTTAEKGNIWDDVGTEKESN